MERRRPANLLRAAALAPVLAGQTAAAFAACPIELAVYEEPQTGAGIDFRPGGNATASNAFRMVLGKGLVLDGFVMWSGARPVAMLTHDCPEGDATAQELAACTLWEGVVYAVDGRGEAGLLPAEGEDAPLSLILSDLGRAPRLLSLLDATAAGVAPGDIFSLSGCQE